MYTKSNNNIRTFLYLPIIGIISFIGLYIYSATLYPGGSQADTNSTGFSWVNNYWCNLMNETAINGESNLARPFAISATIILSISLIIFFYNFTETFSLSRIWKWTIKVSGSLSMIFAIFIFTEYHNQVTTISSILGLIAVIGIMQDIYHSQKLFFKITGVCCIFLLILNNFIYYSEIYLEALPLIQKITLTLVLAWIGALNYEMIKMNQDLLQIKAERHN